MAGRAGHDPLLLYWHCLVHTHLVVGFPENHPLKASAVGFSASAAYLFGQHNNIFRIQA